MVRFIGRGVIGKKIISITKPEGPIPPRRLNPEVYLLKKKSNPGAAKWLTEVIFMAVRTFICIGTIR